MKTVTAYVIAAALLGVLGTASLLMGRLDRDLARAEQHLIQSRYDEVAPILGRAERYYEYAAAIPWIGNGPLHGIRARQAALAYWQREYTAMVPDQPDPLASVPADNVAHQFLMANAMYRHGLGQATDRASTLAALESAASAYQTVLRNADHYHDASFNYEFVVKLRQEIERNRRKTPPPLPASGREGVPGQQPETSLDDAKFKLYVPLEQEQIEKNRPGDAGKQPPIRKKG